MFKGILKFLTKRILPFLAANLDLDVDTVQRADGKFLRVRVEAFNFTLLDKEIPLSDSDPINIYDYAAARNLEKKLTADMMKELKQDPRFDGVLDMPKIKPKKINN